MFTAPDRPADSFLVCDEPMRHLTLQFQLPLLTICDAAEAKRPDLRVQTINRRPAEAPLSCVRDVHTFLFVSKRPAAAASELSPEASWLLMVPHFIQRNICDIEE